MRRSTIIILVCMAAGMAVLVALGSWQVKRLFWKEELIARVEARTAQSPISLSEALASDRSELPYKPMTATGVFDHAQEVYYYATSKSGGAGWNVHTPLQLEDGRTLIVNRGFVPFDYKTSDRREAGQVTGPQTITGLIIVPEGAKPNSFVPDNAPEKREFYWRDLPQMADVMGVGAGADVIPFFLDADDKPNPGGLPDGGTTLVSFPNNHLQYAVTWYGLALTLLGVGGYFLYSRRQVQDG